MGFIKEKVRAAATALAKVSQMDPTVTGAAGKKLSKQALLQDNMQLQEQLAELKIKLRQLQSNSYEAQKDIKRCQDQTVREQQHLTHARAQIEKLHKQLAESSNESKQCKQRAHVALFIAVYNKAQVQTSAANCDVLAGKLQRTRTAKSELQAECERLAQELGKANADILANNATVTQLRAQLNEATQQLISGAAREAELCPSVESLAAEKAAAEQEQQSLRERLCLAAGAMMSEQVVLQQQVAASGKALEEASSRAVKVEESCRRLRHTKMAQASKLRALRKANASLRVKCRLQSAQVGRLDQAVSGLTTAHAQLQQHSTEMEAGLSAAQAASSTAQAALQALEAQAKENEQEAAAKLAAADARVQDLSAQLELALEPEAKAYARMMKHRCEESAAEAAQSKQQAGTYKYELKVLENKLVTKIAMCTAMGEQQSTHEQEMESYRAEVNATMDKYDELLDEYQTSARQANDTAAELQAVVAELRSAPSSEVQTARVGSLEQTVSELTAAKEELQLHCTKLETDVRVTQAELSAALTAQKEAKAESDKIDREASEKLAAADARAMELSAQLAALASDPETAHKEAVAGWQAGWQAGWLAGMAESEVMQREAAEKLAAADARVKELSAQLALALGSESTACTSMLQQRLAEALAEAAKHKEQAAQYQVELKVLHNKLQTKIAMCADMVEQQLKHKQQLEGRQAEVKEPQASLAQG